MHSIIAIIKNSLVVAIAAFAVIACSKAVPPVPEPEKDPPPIADSFAYPISEKEYVTQARDKKDEWYNALDFQEQNHLGEDWNKNSGGNSDCGEPVYAMANGVITYAADAGPGWGTL